MEGLAKVAASFMDAYKEQLRQAYAKQYGLDVSEMTDEKMGEIRKNEQLKGAERSAGMLAGGGAAMLGHKTYREGLLTGRRTFYHNTDKENVDSIKEHGLQASRAADEGNWTHKALGSAIATGNVKEGDLANKVYLANKPSTAFDVGVATQRSDWFPDPMGDIKDALANRKNVKVQMPLDEVEKLKTVENPELRGAKSGAEFHQKMNEFRDQINMDTPPLSGLTDRLGFRGLGKGTTVVEGDIPSEFIKGGKGFNPLTAGEVLQHIKNRPGTFAKGVGLGAGALGLAGAGVKLLHDGYQKTDYHDN